MRLSYLLKSNDRSRVLDLIGKIDPSTPEDRKLSALCERSNWTEGHAFGDWSIGMTISSSKSATPSQAHGDQSFVDKLIGGLSLLDRGRSVVDESDMAAASAALARKMQPTRSLVTSSLSKDAIECLCGQEKAMVLSPRNQNEVLQTDKGEVPPRSWFVVTGNLDQTTCRKLWRASTSGREDLVSAAGLSLHETNDPELVEGLLEGRTPVFFDRQDFRELTQGQDTYIDTIFLRRLLAAPRSSGFAEWGHGLAQAILHNDAGRLDAGSHAKDVLDAYLRLVLVGVRNESQWSPPGSLAKAVATGGSLPDLCGPELTN